MHPGEIQLWRRPAGLSHMGSNKVPILLSFPCLVKSVFMSLEWRRARNLWQSYTPQFRVERPFSRICTVACKVLFSGMQARMMTMGE